MIKWNRNIYRSFIIISFIGLVIVMLFGIGQALSYLNTGADRTAMLHLTLNKKPVYFPKTSWNDTINPGRPIEKQTLLDIKRDYLNAWYVRNIAYQMNTIDGVADYFTKSARKNIYKTMLFNKKENVTIHGTTINHNLHLDFYSADGQLVVISDIGVKEYQRTYKEDVVLVENKTRSNYQVMLMLEDGFWRIRHMVKKNKNEILDSTQRLSTQAKVVGDNIYVDEKEFQIKGINYYPQQTPWDMFGDYFDTTVIQKDFEIIKKAGLNTIRIFVSYEDFGKETVNSTKVNRLQQVLSSAEKAGIKVIVTLFDFYGEYSVLNWTLTHRHAEQIIRSLKDHKAILAWDIKNEPNLDFDSRGKENVLSWLDEMIDQIRVFDPNHLITIGWSDPESAALLKDKVDFVSFHYYREQQDFENVYNKLTEKIDKPLVLQEFGISSNRSLLNPFGYSEKGQAIYHQKFQENIQKRDIHYLSWTLYDFIKIPNDVSGSLPWRKQKQKYFGFIDASGNKKPAFEFISE
ncbi:cellulase family glycosylhydrolase [Aquimarina pacifica]|uniref:cellulase family glycosylhydrolase n=1 Tax=Aquimarina pacifica TaxID=1296415 RepID=UPI0004713EF8|nr:cellulase family glycosylhydrolase [Aquimarina pacifica]